MRMNVGFYHLHPLYTRQFWGYGQVTFWKTFTEDDREIFLDDRAQDSKLRLMLHHAIHQLWSGQKCFAVPPVPPKGPTYDTSCASAIREFLYASGDIFVGETKSFVFSERNVDCVNSDAASLAVHCHRSEYDVFVELGAAR